MSAAAIMKIKLSCNILILFFNPDISSYDDDPYPTVDCVINENHR